MAECANIRSSRGSIFHSYRQYLASLAEKAPEYHWLRCFFNEPVAQPRTSVLLLECSGSKIRSVPDFDAARLNHSPADVSVRIVMLTYQELSGLDRNMLDMVAFALDLEPISLWQLFDHDLSHLDNSFCSADKISRSAPMAMQLPSGSRSLTVQFDYYGTERLMAMIVEPTATMSTTSVVLLCQTKNGQHQAHNLLGRLSVFSCSDVRSLPASQNLVDYYEYLITSWDDKLVRLAEQEPIRFIMPCLKLLQREAWLDMQISSLKVQDMIDTNLSEFWSNDLKAEQEEIFTLQSALNLANAALDDFRRFVRLYDSGSILETKNAISDFESLIHRSKQLKEGLKDHIERRTALISLEESSKSIQMANSVTTLTQIAFVFVPMTFATSIFGANVKEMGSGDVPVWALFATILLISITTMVGWGIHTGAIQRHVAGRCQWLYCLVLFALRKPYSATMLSLCTMFETHERRAFVLMHLGLTPTLIGGTERYAVDIALWPRAGVEDSSWEAFQKNRAHDVACFTSQPGWQDELLHRRFLGHIRRKKINSQMEVSQQEHPNDRSVV